MSNFLINVLISRFNRRELYLRRERLFTGEFFDVIFFTHSYVYEDGPQQVWLLRATIFVDQSDSEPLSRGSSIIRDLVGSKR